MNDKEKIEKLAAALKAAKDHLDYCNYGDQHEWEAARASRLEQTIDEALACVGDQPRTEMPYVQGQVFSDSAKGIVFGYVAPTEGEQK